MSNDVKTKASVRANTRLKAKKYLMQDRFL